MTTPNTRARIARISALVIIGVALLAAGVSPVVVTLWVLLVAVPVLVTLRLVLNLLDGAAQDTPARIGRIMALVITGVALLAAGVSSVMTLWSSSFARFMHLEDLGMTHLAEITRITAVDRGLLISGGILALLGAAALIAAAVLAHRRRPAGR
ncbi:MAG TPA: hypothetical protein VLM76_09935 [Patescibacteria group bacterium]|nr:hypothetical protein [Patescibacteria group bacterium]